MKNSLKALLVGAVFALVGCDSEDIQDFERPPVTPIPDQATVQIVHAVSNAPTVTVQVNGDDTLTGVDYKVASGELLLDSSATYEVVTSLEGADADTTLTPVPELSLPAGTTFMTDVNYTVIATGQAGGTLALDIIERPVQILPTGEARLAAVHAAANAPAVDVYVTAVDADLTTIDPLNTAPLNFGDPELTLEDVVPGEYQLRITVAGSKTAIAFDSGPITITDGDDYVAIAVDNVDAGAADIPGTMTPVPVSVLLVSSAPLIELQDVNTGIEARVTHAVPDVGAVGDPTQGGVDISANMTPIAALDNLLFTETRGPLALDAGEYTFEVFPTGTMNAVITATDTLSAGNYYDIIAVGSVVADTLDLFIGTSDRRVVATDAKARIIHGSASAGAVDVYLADPGTDSVAGLDPVDGLAGIELGADSGFQNLPAGEYQILVALADTETVAISACVALSAGGIYTIIANDPVLPSTDFGVLLLDDAPGACTP